MVVVAAEEVKVEVEGVVPAPFRLECPSNWTRQAVGAAAAVAAAAEAEVAEAAARRSAVAGVTAGYRAAEGSHGLPSSLW